MKQLACEVCGGTDLIKDGGVFVCQTCGCKYSVEEVRKMILGDDAPAETGRTAVADRTKQAEDYLRMAISADELDNAEETIMYANKVLEIDGDNAEALYLKGKTLVRTSSVTENNVKAGYILYAKSLHSMDNPEKTEKYIMMLQQIPAIYSFFLKRQIATIEYAAGPSDILKIRSNIFEHKKENIEVWMQFIQNTSDAGIDREKVEGLDIPVSGKIMYADFRVAVQNLVTEVCEMVKKMKGLPQIGNSNMERIKAFGHCGLLVQCLEDEDQEICFEHLTALKEKLCAAMLYAGFKGFAMSAIISKQFDDDREKCSKARKEKAESNRKSYWKSHSNEYTNLNSKLDQFTERRKECQSEIASLDLGDKIVKSIDEKKVLIPQYEKRMNESKLGRKKWEKEIDKVKKELEKLEATPGYGRFVELKAEIAGIDEEVSKIEALIADPFEHEEEIQESISALEGDHSA